VDSVTNRRSAGSLALNISDSIDAEVFFDPLREFINTVRDETLLQRVFARLRDRSLGVVDTASGMAIAIRQLFPEDQKTFVQRQRFEELLESVSRFKDMKATKIIIHPAWRYGEKIESRLAEAYVQHIVPTLNLVWNNFTLPNSYPTLEHAPKSDIFNQPVGAKSRTFDSNKSKAQILLIYSRVQLGNNRLTLNHRLVDGADGIILGSFARDVELSQDEAKFKKDLLENLMAIRNEFLYSLNGYQRFAQLLEEKALDFISFDRFKAYQLYGAQMSVRRAPKADHDEWLLADGIFVYKPLIQKGPRQAFGDFCETLERRLQKRQSILSVPLYFEGKPSANSLSISAAMDINKPKQLDILVENKSIPVQTIELKFSRSYSERLKTDEVYYMADFVVESIQSLLSINTTYLSPPHLSKRESALSLLFAGAAQFSIAERIRPYNPGKVRRWGYLCRL
jgi:hypothetical protein